MAQQPPSGSLSFDEGAALSEIQLRLEAEMSGSQRGKMVLELDLNDPPVPPPDYGRAQPPQPAKDFEVIDDDVVIISSRIFAEAKNNTTRVPEVRDVVDAEIEVNFHRAEASTSYPHHRTKRRRLLRNQAVLNWENYMNSEDITKVQANDEKVVPPSKAAAPSFNCPICMGTLSEETSTKCGHIFCKKCIEAAIKVQHKCPTCRHKLRIKDIIRIYLPTNT